MSSYVVVVSHPSMCSTCGGDQRMTVHIPDAGIEADISCPHCTDSQPLLDLLEHL